MAPADALPVPESLLVPLLDTAADVLGTLGDADRPPVLRPLGGFDRRGLQSSTARQQLRRAIDVDDGFRERVVERFLERPEVDAALTAWTPSGALRRVDEAAERSDLPSLASALYAARPDGWTFGLGVVCSAFDRKRSEKERDDDLKARETQLATADEARRRAEQARDQAVGDAARLEEQLREERRARRERDRQATREIEDAARRRKEAEVATDEAQAATAAVEARVAREAERARAAEQRVRALQRERKAAETASTAPPPLPVPEVEALAAATEEARRLTAALEGVTRRARDAASEHDARESAAAAAAPKASSSSRVAAPCPPGMQADTADALDAMLRTRGITLVVDGYNVSMAGWPEVAVADQRERLVAELARLHLRLRCDVVVVFDGADVEGVTPPRRTGVRVVFSNAGQDADPVVISEVAGLPLSAPAIVASTDQWVQEHARDEGATVVPAVALLAVLRR
jgi:predicted RNA-binding protein with PIN domain